jgi:hypothetical protein
MRIIDRLIAKFTRRPPDFQIGGAENPYCNRWWVIPRNRWFNIYLHEFVRDDEDRALHDHPWPNCSIPLRNGYIEVLFAATPRQGLLPREFRRTRRPGSITFRRATTAHRVELLRASDGSGITLPAWSLFVTGPVIRDWGFWCSWGWRHWRDFTAGANGEMVGKGCD